MLETFAREGILPLEGHGGGVVDDLAADLRVI
jgi:hypothetical protein